jgi:hypothetical protein
MAENESLPERVALSFLQLKAISEQLNAVSGELGKTITLLDEKLQRLNLGVPAWVKVRGGDSDSGENYWLLELGYAKVARNWGIAIRERSGSYLDASESGETWLFPNAPRVHRVAAVDKLPDLLAKLTLDATETAQQLREKIVAAQEVVAAFGEPAKPKAKEQQPTKLASTAHQASNAGGTLTSAIADSLGPAGVIEKAMAGINIDELSRSAGVVEKAMAVLSTDQLSRAMENAQKAMGGAMDPGRLSHAIENAQKAMGTVGDIENLSRALTSAEESYRVLSGSDAVRALKGRRK